MHKLVMVSCLVSGERRTAFVRLPVSPDGKVRLPDRRRRQIFDPPAGSLTCLGY